MAIPFITFCITVIIFSCAGGCKDKDKDKFFPPGTATGTGTAGPPQVVSETLRYAVEDEPYEVLLSAQGGQQPYTWSNSGNLPAGLALYSNGAILGTPATGGSYVFDAIATGSDNQTGTNSFTINVCIPSGWDYNLTKRCVRTALPGELYYYEDLTDVGPDNMSWLIGSQAEQSYGCSTVGPNGQSLPINEIDSNLTLDWTPKTDEFGRPNYMVKLKIDVSSIPHPGGPGNWTWYAFMDHNKWAPGMRPPIKKLLMRFRVNYNDFTPNGSARLIAGAGAYWDGRPHIIEINLVSTNWGDAYPDEDDIVSTSYNASRDFVSMHGPAMGYNINKLVDTDVEIDWEPIFLDLINRGYFTGPTGGWETTTMTVPSVRVAIEGKNITVDNAVIVVAKITNLRVLEKP